MPADQVCTTLGVCRPSPCIQMFVSIVLLPSSLPMGDRLPRPCALQFSKLPEIVATQRCDPRPSRPTMTTFRIQSGHGRHERDKCELKSASRAYVFFVRQEVRD